MPTRKNSDGRIKLRRQGALQRLENPSPNLKKRIESFTPEQLKSHNARVETEISVLKKRINRTE